MYMLHILSIMLQIKCIYIADTNSFHFYDENYVKLFAAVA